MKLFAAFTATGKVFHGPFENMEKASRLWEAFSAYMAEEIASTAFSASF